MLFGHVVVESSWGQVRDARMDSLVQVLTHEEGGRWSVEEAMEAHGLQGLSLAVINDFEVVGARAFGLKKAGEGALVDTATAYSTGSISKVVTATLVVLLAEEGLLDLDAPVSSYLKRWSLPDNPHTQVTPITLRHLLNHTAGTTQHGFMDFYEGDERPSLVQSLNGDPVARTPPLMITHTPGSEWRYSGGGYVIAQVAIEDELGKPLAALAQHYLFEPLGMTRTTMYQPDEEAFFSNVARAHYRDGEVIRTGLPICPQVAPSGMWSTPLDIARLMLAFQRALDGEEEGVISPTVAQEMMTPGKGGFGLGWMVSDSLGSFPAFSHGGSNTGTGGEVVGTLEEGHGMVVFGNGPSELRNPIIAQLKARMVEVFGW